MKTNLLLGSRFALLFCLAANICFSACNAKQQETANTKNVENKYPLEDREFYTNILCQSIYAYDDTEIYPSFHFADETLYDIRQHFCLDTLFSEKDGTYIKAAKIQRFVSDNLPHGNPQGMPEANNAIGLWAFAQQPDVNLNCRQHSMVLRDMLMSVGIRARYVTCLSNNPEDCDCHVVNEFYDPGFEKWIMIDSDMDALVSDTCGVPLSLRELRSKLAHNEPYLINGMPNEGNYYDTYMAKNTYWFAMHEMSIADDESSHIEGDRMLVLVPVDFEPYIYENPVVTTDDEKFWK